MDKKNVFIISLDEYNLSKLKAIPGAAKRYEFHPLLDFDEIPRTFDEIADVDLLYKECIRRLREFPGTIDAVTTFWDFPASELQPLICREMGLPSASIEAVLKCHHKYWSRVEQAMIAPYAVPPFEAVDIYDDDSVADIGLEEPYWLKPVRAYSSHLGFKIGDDQDLEEAVGEIRDKLPRLSVPFEQVLRRAELPPGIDAMGGNCVAEGLIGGRQCTLEGWSFNGEVEVYGVVDSIRHPNRSTFARYQYPSRLPRPVQDRMIDIAEQFIRHIGYENQPFNMEFFWRQTDDAIFILEINSRMSQSHGYLFEEVDGSPNHKVAVDIATGKRPAMPYREGAYACAGKFYIRHGRDRIVTRRPTREELAELDERFPTAHIQIEVEEGMRLEDLTDQDSYSYELGTVYLAAHSQKQLLRKYRAIENALTFEFEPVPVKRRRRRKVKRPVPA